MRKEKIHKKANRVLNIIIWGCIIFLIGIRERENIMLYKQGQTTKALVYRRTSKGRRGVSLYEFRVSGIRYTGHDSNSKVGDSIQVVYLPKKPKIKDDIKFINCKNKKQV